MAKYVTQACASKAAHLCENDFRTLTRVIRPRIERQPSLAFRRKMLLNVDDVLRFYEKILPPDSYADAVQNLSAVSGEAVG